MDVMDCIVAGGGVVGLAIARRLALRGLGVVLIEKNAAPGQETSARNSEVIHAGIYYPKGSLKARLCVSGRAMLLDYLRDRALPHALIGKIIAGQALERDKLALILEKAKANGVSAIREIGGSELSSLEPELKAEIGLLSPGTGIFDSAAYMQALEADLVGADGLLSTGTRVEKVRHDGQVFRVSTVDAHGERFDIGARFFVNAAGHGAGELARNTEMSSGWAAPELRFARGTYYGVTGPSPFRHLVYPLPEQGGLGIHSTLDLQGATRFGPDVEWIDQPSYALSDARLEGVRKAIAHYWPGVADREIAPLFCGVRPKLAGRNEPDADFLIAGSETHGQKNLVHLMGIESPGLTASLAIAAHVTGLLGLD